jgi:hypothetical protein
MPRKGTTGLGAYASCCERALGLRATYLRILVLLCPDHVNLRVTPVDLRRSMRARGRLGGTRGF